MLPKMCAFFVAPIGTSQRTSITNVGKSKRQTSLQYMIIDIIQ